MESALAFQGFAFLQRVVMVTVWKPMPSARLPHLVAWCKAHPKGQEYHCDLQPSLPGETGTAPAAAQGIWWCALGVGRTGLHI